MEGRKRLWEDDSPIDLQFKRRASTFVTPKASSFRLPSPLPQRAGYYSRDARGLNQRRLPPLYTSSCNPSAAPTTFHLAPLTAQVQPPSLLDSPRPRSQSLFDIFQHPYWQDQERNTGMYVFFGPPGILARQTEARFARQVSAQHSLLI
jgi:hypothetical protein